MYKVSPPPIEVSALWNVAKAASRDRPLLASSPAFETHQMFAPFGAGPVGLASVGPVPVGSVPFGSVPFGAPAPQPDTALVSAANVENKSSDPTRRALMRPPRGTLTDPDPLLYLLELARADPEEVEDRVQPRRRDARVR